MKKIKHLVALTTAMALLASSAYADECCDEGAYTDSCEACYSTALIPVGALVVAGVIIAATDRNHHHHSTSSSSSHSHSHSHSH